MRPEARPIEFTNGRTHFYGKTKVNSRRYHAQQKQAKQQINIIQHILSSYRKY